MLAAAAPASAGGQDTAGSADATKDAHGNPVVIAMSDLDKPALPGRRGTGTVTCVWFENAVHDPVGDGDPVGRQPGSPVDWSVGLVEDDWYFLHCTNADGVVVREGWRQWTPADAQTLATELAYEAARELPIPYPRPALSPAIGTDQLVGLTTWLWIESGTWRPLDATAAVPGLSATATATPTTVTWDMGDGTTVTCDGPGTPYNAAIGDDAQSTDCSHTYIHTSDDQADGAYAATVTIEWGIAWTATNGQAGTLPSTSRTTTFSVPVTERQAVVCYGASSCDD
jgi:hypothetical protein